MVDDVPDSISLYAGRRKESGRTISLPRELTSRVSQKEIIEILSELKRSAGEPDCVDVVLATNMVSVGVDVPRLGLMIVNGQPKTRSEYIQSTSRVGRSAFPGLVVSVLNAAKARDRSHYETYPSWHSKIYRDVEATSVTPFASRSRDRALRAVLAAMVRHGDPIMAAKPNLALAPEAHLSEVVAEVERRIHAIDPRELAESRREIDEGLDDWDVRSPSSYLNRHKPNQSLLQYAEDYASRVAAGRLPGAAWPAMNTMRSVEPSSRFRLTEFLSSSASRPPSSRPPSADEAPQADDARPQPRWRNRNA
jgi:superfamily II DNA/RNA helicase